MYNMINKYIILCILFYGCVPGFMFTYVTDVSVQNELWGGYEKNGIYKLKYSMFLRTRENVPTPNKDVLVPPKQTVKGVCNLYYSSPKTIGDYEINRGKWKDVVGIVKAGTEIKCTKILKYHTVGYGDSIYIFAVILSGKYSNIEVEISDLSLTYRDKKTNLFLHSPNPELLINE